MFTNVEVLKLVIYKITNVVNNKMYIGQTVDYEERVRHHKQVAFRKNSKEKHKPLYRAIKKHGLNNFKFEIIDHAQTMDELNEKEIYWIDFYDSCVDSGKGYNLDKGGKNGLKSEHTKEKIRNAQLGEKCWNYGLRGSNCHNAKRVMNITTGKVYNSLIDCAIDDFGDRRYMKQISAVCSPTSNKKTVKEYEYRLLDENGSIIETNKQSNSKTFQAIPIIETMSNR